ncbi:MAG: hypothetical protein U1E42_13130 [Rhodospirillales bacterium]
MSALRRPFSFAVALHVAALLMMFVVLPSWPEKRPPLDEPIVVEMVTAAPAGGGGESRRATPAPTGDRADEAAPPSTPVKPLPTRPAPPRVSEAPAPEPAAKPPAPEPTIKPPPPSPPPPAEPVPEPMRAARPKPKAEPPPREEPKVVAEKAPEGTVPPKTLARAEPKATAKPEPKPESKPEPKPENKPEPKPAVKPEAKPEAKAETKPPTKSEAKSETKPDSKPDANDFAAVGRTLKDLRQRAPAAATAPGSPKSAPADDDGDFSTQMSKALKGGGATAATAPSAASSASSASSASAAAGSGSVPVTAGEIDSVRRQIEQCWSLPANVKPTKDLVVQIKVEMNQDGTPRTALIQDTGRMGDAAYRATAESARRAVLNPRCHPFKLPRDKYDRWRTLNLVFNPAEMFGT